MAGHSNTSNRGIAHITYRMGCPPLCRTPRPHIVTTPDQISAWPRVCVKCRSVHEKAAAKAAARAAAE